MSATEDRDWKRLDAWHHDREAPRYDELIGREYAPYQATHTARPWARLLSESGAGLVVDVGAGTGRTAVPVAEAGLAVVALDTSVGMLRQCRRKARAAGLDRVWCVIGDAEHLPLAGSAVDGVVCQGVLHHLPDVRAALAEADRVLRPGKWMCLAEPDARGSWLSRAVAWWVEAARPVIERARPRRSPAAANERPLDPRELLVPLADRFYTVSVEYLVHPPYVYRYLPAAVSAWVAAGLNAGRARRAGDIVVVRARKRPPAT